MENERVVVKGTPEKNKIAWIMLIAGIVLVIVSFGVAGYVFDFCDGYKYLGLGYGGWYTWDVIYDSFGAFYKAQFFNFACYYGYVLIIGIIVAIAGVIIKVNTEKCEITVTVSRIYGKIKGGNDIEIPLNQVTGIHPCSFEGISISSISGQTSNFYLMANREEIMKGLSFLLANGRAQTGVSGNFEQTGDAAKIKQYKELLDAGVISQEEFDAKKKQSLEL